MANRLNEDFLRELRERNEISEVISPYVNLRRRGTTMNGLCPFHNEKTPSFTVYLETQSFYCFGCGAGGDVITFIRRIENLGYIDAVKSLAQRAGMALPEDGFDDVISKRRRRILEANREAARFFHNVLMSEQGKTCLNYYLSRGYSMSTIRRFGMGYAPDDWRALYNHLHSLGYTPGELVDANLVRKSDKNGKVNYYDNFRNRAMIPIIDVRGNVVAFGGRVLDDSKPKYINTSDTLVYKKGSGVFALNLAKDSGERRLIITEGYMDTIALHQAGFKNTIACLGTALPDEQVNLISRYADEVLLAYDSDEAGQKAVRRAIQAFSKTGVKVRVLALSGGKDPDEIIKKFGAERFRNIVDGAANDIEYRLQGIRAKYNTMTDDGKIGFMREAVSVLAAISSEIERDVYISRLSNDLEISKEAIAAQVKSVRKRSVRTKQNEEFKRIQASSFTEQGRPVPLSNIGALRAEEALIANLMRTPANYRKCADRLSADIFLSDFGKTVFSAILPYLERGEMPEYSVVIGNMSGEYASNLSRIINTKINTGNSAAECSDCIDKLIEEKAKQDVSDPSALSDEEFRKLFNQD
ncbi:MAG: DNA primase [Clostridia bacterium]|nr:DNA primase [Clostridia bacterium]